MIDILHKYGRKKIYFGIAFILIAISIIISFFIHQSKLTFLINGQKFKYLCNAENMILFRDDKGSDITVTIEDKNLAEFSIINKYQIQYENKIIKSDASDIITKGRIITVSDGREYVQDVFYFALKNTNHLSISNQPFEVQLVNNIDYTYDFVQRNEIIAISFFAIPLIFLGLGSFMYPEKLWRFKHILSVYGGEPTELAIFSNRLAGIIIIGFALIIPFIIM